MTAASDGKVRRRTTRATGAQARQRRHRQRIIQAQLDFVSAAAPADPRSRAEAVGIGCWS